LLLRLGRWFLVNFVFRAINPGILQRLHLTVVDVSPLQWQSPSITSLRNFDFLNDRRPPSQDERCTPIALPPVATAMLAS
jgi:hypothetical protein